MLGRKVKLSLALACVISNLFSGVQAFAEDKLTNSQEVSVTSSIITPKNNTIIDDDLNLEWVDNPTTSGYMVVLESSMGIESRFVSDSNKCKITQDNFIDGEVYTINVYNLWGKDLLDNIGEVTFKYSLTEFSSGCGVFDMTPFYREPVILSSRVKIKPLLISKTVDELPKVTEEEFFVVNEALASVGKEVSPVEYLTDKEEVQKEKMTLGSTIVYNEIPKDERWARIFPDGRKYATASEASSHIVTVEIPAWNINDNGEKYVTTYSLQVNEALAEEVVNIFTEIFNDPEQFPIKCIGGWRWSYLRSGNPSQHNYGTCIDINPDENYMIRADGSIEYPGVWEPYENPYSITPDGSVIRVFRKYGWGWGGADWQSSRDYMHMTYLGG